MSAAMGAGMSQTTVGMNLPTADDLADVEFTPAFYTRFPSDQRGQGQSW